MVAPARVESADVAILQGYLSSACTFTARLFRTKGNVFVWGEDAGNKDKPTLIYRLSPECIHSKIIDIACGNAFALFMDERNRPYMNGLISGYEATDSQLIPVEKGNEHKLGKLKDYWVTSCNESIFSQKNKQEKSELARFWN